MKILIIFKTNIISILHILRDWCCHFNSLIWSKQDRLGDVLSAACTLMLSCHEAPCTLTMNCYKLRVFREFWPRRLIWRWFYQLSYLESIVASFTWETYILWKDILSSFAKHIIYFYHVLLLKSLVFFLHVENVSGGWYN